MSFIIIPFAYSAEHRPYQEAFIVLDFAQFVDAVHLISPSIGGTSRSWTPLTASLRPVPVLNKLY